MTYATQQDLVDRFGQQELLQLTDRTNSGSIDGAVVSKALSDADGLINTHLTARYTLPFASAPSVLKRTAGDIARYFLYEDKATEQVSARYNDAMKFLRSVADGSVTLGVDASSQQPAQPETVQFETGQKVFGREDL